MKQTKYINFGKVDSTNNNGFRIGTDRNSHVNYLI